MPKNKMNYFIQVKKQQMMQRKVIEPGGLYFGDDEDIIYTLLGSCVAVTLWHPTKKLAAMSHIILPKMGKNERHNRYGDCAIDCFINMIKKYKTTAHDYEVGIYGGGKMFSKIFGNKKPIVGDKNVEEVVGLLNTNDFKLKFIDVGGEMPRKLTLFRKTGEIELEHVTAN